MLADLGRARRDIEGVASLELGKGSSPEMIGKATEPMFESKKHDFDFPAIGVDGDDLCWAQIQIGAHQDVSVFPVDDPDKADEIVNGFPKEIFTIVSHCLGFSIDCHVSFLEKLRKTKNRH